MRRPIAMIFFLVTASTAGATTPAWHSTSGSNSLTWTAKWQGTPVKGVFPDFQVTGAFDAGDPAGGTINVKIGVSSVKSASGDVTRAIRGKPWFDTAEYPQASFEGKFAGQQNSLRLRGTLSLKGQHKHLSIPVKLRHDGANRIRLSGEFELDRSEFAIGTGRWQNSRMIAKSVTVDFSVVLARKN